MIGDRFQCIHYESPSQVAFRAFIPPLGIPHPVAHRTADSALGFQGGRIQVRQRADPGQQTTSQSLCRFRHRRGIVGEVVNDNHAYSPQRIQRHLFTRLERLEELQHLQTSTPDGILFVPSIALVKQDNCRAGGCLGLALEPIGDGQRRRGWLRAAGSRVGEPYRKDRQFLFATVVEDLKVLPREASNRVTLFVANQHTKLHQPGIDANNRRFRLLRLSGGSQRWEQEGQYDDQVP